MASNKKNAQRKGRGIEEVDGSLGPGLKSSAIIPPITNATLKNNSESQVSHFIEMKKLQWGPGVALLEGRFNSFYGSICYN